MMFVQRGRCSPNVREGPWFKIHNPRTVYRIVSSPASKLRTYIYIYLKRYSKIYKLSWTILYFPKTEAKKVQKNIWNGERTEKRISEVDKNMESTREILKFKQMCELNKMMSTRIPCNMWSKTRGYSIVHEFPSSTTSISWPKHEVLRINLI